MFRWLAVSFAVFAAAAPASAQEAFVGVLTHGVDTPFTFDTGEGGVDLQAGYRFAPIEGLAAIGRPAPYLIASLNTRGDTSFAGAGIAWTIGKGKVYLRPGVGVVVHDGPGYRVDPATMTRTDLGSRVLFSPELGLGLRLDERLSLEANWTHISHARLFDAGQNPGIDMMGLRLNYRTR
jgi:lipid A 3-O-deacylase